MMEVNLSYSELKKVKEHFKVFFSKDWFPRLDQKTTWTQRTNYSGSHWWCPVTGDVDFYIDPTSQSSRV